MEYLLKFKIHTIRGHISTELGVIFRPDHNPFISLKSKPLILLGFFCSCNFPTRSIYGKIGFFYTFFLLYYYIFFIAYMFDSFHFLFEKKNPLNF